ncbi:MAG: hypothetical protein KGS61_10400 [Verrucomicrobia bacterium]|nr:hypothetical protein [Verrucomicrobiota bacterium]
MDPDLERWAVTRQQGRRRYVLLAGGPWSGVMFGVMTFWLNRPRGQPLTPGWIAFNAFVWALGGYAFGRMMWYLNERRYRKAVDLERRPPPIATSNSTPPER